MAGSTDILVRDLAYEDCSVMAAAFNHQGWNKTVERFTGYFQEQERELRKVLIATVQQEFAGYLTIVWNSHYPPFSKDLIPEIADFNVLQKFQRRGVGSRLMDTAERAISERSNVAGIRVGLMADYAAALQLYIERGYLPDGKGISYRNMTSQYGDQVVVDDDLTLGFIKRLDREVN